MRHWMESAGWLQGSIVKCENVAQLLKLIGKSDRIDNPDVILIVASGSCDIANEADLVIEFSIARSIQEINGNFSYNKNPRCLHCTLESASSSIAKYSKI